MTNVYHITINGTIVFLLSNYLSVHKVIPLPGYGLEVRFWAQDERGQWDEAQVADEGEPGHGPVEEDKC